MTSERYYGESFWYREVKCWLYQRKDGGSYHAKIQLPDEKLIRKSLKVRSRSAADEKIRDLVSEALFLQSKGEALTKRSFSHVGRDFIRFVEREVENEQSARSKLVDARRYIDGLFDPFFGKFRIDRIGRPEISQYRDWRSELHTTYSDTIQYVRNGKLVVQKRGKTKSPALTTLQREDSMLRSIFKFAADRGDISPDKIPEIKTKKAKLNKRPSFSLSEWKVLIKTARNRCSAKLLWENLTVQQRQSGVTGITREVLSRRQLLYEYVLIMGSTGLRTMEARELRWKDIERFTSREGRSLMRLSVRGKGKSRKAIPLPRVATYLDRMKTRQKEFSELYEFPFGGSGEYVFSDHRGRPVGSFKKSFRELVAAAGLTEDFLGNTWSPYSMRHTYATLRLTLGNVDIYELAVNMGTSVEMIQKYYSDALSEDFADRLVSGSR